MAVRAARETRALERPKASGGRIGDVTRELGLSGDGDFYMCVRGRRGMRWRGARRFRGGVPWEGVQRTFWLIARVALGCNLLIL